MDPKLLTQIAFIGGGACYLLMAAGLYMEGKPWMAITFTLYATTIGTLYMGGNN
jgi:hypothetical protein